MHLDKGQKLTKGDPSPCIECKNGPFNAVGRPLCMAPNLDELQKLQ